MSRGNGKRTAPRWEDVADIGKRFGWFPELVRKERLEFEKGRQKIVAKRIPGTSKWKVEYFSGSIMDDTTGSETEDLAKRLTAEMLFLK